MATEQNRVDKLEHHLQEIERGVRRARGDEIDVTPWDFNIPTGTDMRALREQCGLDREEAAEMIGYSSNTITQVETGHKPPGRAFIQKSLLLYKREWPR